jgi:hypothetical protein
VTGGEDPAGPGQEQQVGSVSYRLRNATAQCVKQGHQLLADPEVVGSEVDEYHHNRYYKELDKKCNELWKKTKQWTGGQSYVQSARCVSDSSRSSAHVGAMVHHTEAAAFSLFSPIRLISFGPVTGNHVVALQ